MKIRAVAQALCSLLGLYNSCCTLIIRCWTHLVFFFGAYWKMLFTEKRIKKNKKPSNTTLLKLAIWSSAHIVFTQKWNVPVNFWWNEFQFETIWTCTWITWSGSARWLRGWKVHRLLSSHPWDHFREGLKGPIGENSTANVLLIALFSPLKPSL